MAINWHKVLTTRQKKSLVKFDKGFCKNLFSYPRKLVRLGDFPAKVVKSAAAT